MIDQHLTRHLRILLWPGPRIIFEIGACEGEHTAGYGRAFPSAKFYLFEPLPTNCEKIAAMLSQEKWLPAEVFAIALSNEAGEAEFHVSSSQDASRRSEANKSSSLMQPRAERPRELEWLEFKETIKVKTDTLDAWCRRQRVRHIDFIHMDVQGAELRVLAGAEKMLPRIKAIWMEVAFQPSYEGQPLEPDATRWMADRGFRKIHQVSYGAEGDALYYNMGMALSWPRFVALRMMQKFGLVAR